MNTPRSLVNSLHLWAAGRRDRLPVVCGYGVLWDCPTGRHTGGEHIVLREGCFDETIRGGETVFIQSEHIGSKVMASTGTGSARLLSNSLGLFVAFSPSHTPSNRKIVEDIRDGKLGASVRFTGGQGYRWSKGDRRLNLITSARLVEISVTTRPAIEATYLKIAGENLAHPLEAVDVAREYAASCGVHNRVADIEPEAFIADDGRNLVNQAARQRAVAALAFV